MTTTVLTGDPHAENTLANPRLVAPQMIFDGDFSARTLPAHSLTVIETGVVQR